jgi:hypothetical protein
MEPDGCSRVIDLHIQRPAFCQGVLSGGTSMNTTKIKTLAIRADRTPVKALLAAAALALAMLAIPTVGHSQGIVRGAEEGAYRGNRAAGPVGGVVGGAIGAGVGGAVGAVNGVLGIPNHGPRYRYHRRHRCNGYYRHGRFHCYR